LFWSKRSPLAVFLPWKSGPYHDAVPTCRKFAFPLDFSLEALGLELEEAAGAD
jgi:hypothetical protein